MEPRNFKEWRKSAVKVFNSDDGKHRTGCVCGGLLMIRDGVGVCTSINHDTWPLGQFRVSRWDL